MKTPEEVKKGLECCITVDAGCEECAYAGMIMCARILSHE